ncbi:putative allantoate permease [Lophium mytilinum]|uniref:Putative allantoate permease n=1 Tax=Lophium mytilinum TaxID=390894 RepID=A0A6A6QAA0_9PEZI|nr:putative allantoate permease [Lophium mytilinum]
MERAHDAELGDEKKVSIDVRRAATDNDSATDKSGQVSETLFIDPVAEKSYVRKLDMYLLPVLAIMYFCRYTTGGNIGNAKTDGMDKDLHLHGEQYSTMMTLINVPFVLLEPVQTMMVKRYGGRRVIPCLLFGWGIVSMCQSTVTNYAGILTCRLLISCFQSGFFSGCIFYLTLFYKRDELAFRTAVFYGTATIAGAFTGLISYGVFQINGDIKGWKILFLIEGAMTLVWGSISFWLIPNSPSDCKWLTADEKQAARTRLMVDSTAVVNSQYSLSTGLRALTDHIMWPFMLLCISYGVATKSTGTFLPQIVGRLKYSVIKTNLYTVAPNLVGCVFTLLLTYSSDWFHERTTHLCIGLTFTMVGYLMLAGMDPLKDRGASYAGTFFLSMGTYIPSCLVHSWHNNIKTDENSRAMITGVMVGFSSIGSIISAQLFREEWAPKYTQALAGTGSFQGLAIIITLALGLWMRRENRRRDREMGLETPLKPGDTPQCELIGGAKDVRFRYWV